MAIMTLDHSDANRAPLLIMSALMITFDVWKYHSYYDFSLW